MKFVQENMRCGERRFQTEQYIRMRISHKHKKDIPNWLFSEMLRQAGIDKAMFVKILDLNK